MPPRRHCSGRGAGARTLRAGRRCGRGCTASRRTSACASSSVARSPDASCRSHSVRACRSRPSPMPITTRRGWSRSLTPQPESHLTRLPDQRPLPRRSMRCALRSSLRSRPSRRASARSCCSVTWSGCLLMRPRRRSSPRSRPRTRRCSGLASGSRTVSRTDRRGARSPSTTRADASSRGMSRRGRPGMSLGSWPCLLGTPSGPCHRGANGSSGASRSRSSSTWAWRRAGDRQRLVPTAANGQPAFGYYRPARNGRELEAFAIQVIDVDGQAIRKITNFVEPRLFAAFGLPQRLASTGR